MPEHHHLPPTKVVVEDLDKNFTVGEEEPVPEHQQLPLTKGIVGDFDKVRRWSEGASARAPATSSDRAPATSFDKAYRERL